MQTNPFSRTVGAGTTFLSPADLFLNIDTSEGEVTVVLPKISTVYEYLLKQGSFYSFVGIRFVDISNNAETNNITILPHEDDNLNGASSVVLNTNGVGGVIVLLGDNAWSYTPNAVSSGGGSEYTETIVTADMTSIENDFAFSLPELVVDSYVQGYVLVELDNSNPLKWFDVGEASAQPVLNQSGQPTGSFVYVINNSIGLSNGVDIRVGCGMYADFGSGFETRRITFVGTDPTWYPNTILIRVENQPESGFLQNVKLGTLQVFGFGIYAENNPFYDYEELSQVLSFDSPKMAFRYNFSTQNVNFGTYSNGNGFPSGTVTMKFYLKPDTFGA
jgi:hypothetical protein